VFFARSVGNGAGESVMGRLKTVGLVFLVAFLGGRAALSPVFGQAGRTGPLVSFEFIDQQIQDILYAFSLYAKISIIADDTVSGTASFQFNGADFEHAFDSFLLTNRLYVEKSADVWVVSRISVSRNSEGTILLDALDASPSQLIEKLSRRTSSTIITDILPAAKLSLHLETPSLEEAVELVMKPFSDYTVNREGSYIQVKRTPVEPFAPSSAMSPGSIYIHKSGTEYDISLENARLGDVLEQLFFTAEEEYTSFAQSGHIIEQVMFNGKPLAESLALILEQANGEYQKINNRWYIFPIQQAEIINRLKDEGKVWRRFTLKYLSVNEFALFMNSRFPALQSVAVSDGSDFLAFADERTASDLQGYIRTIDIPRYSEPVKLKYIRTEDLFKTLPPSVKREELIDAGNGNTLFFLGTPERLQGFLKDLAVIDRPQPRIRYDLFIIQVEETSGMNWGISVESREMRPGDTTMVTGQLGNIFNLNFDIITVFGYQFAAKINSAISENQASVFADTTLFGLSGQEIKFQNTSTYRYRDTNTDPETGKPIYSGITREIVSGLVLNINGWVSGDGMITTTVTASVSKRGADVSSTVGNPPPTSEKILTTQVRSRSGETVILSGLKQNDSTIVEQRVPFISKIPILGWFFRNRNTTKENTQMIIYLVPHVDLSSDEYAVEGLKTASIYNRLVVPFLESGS
jgi:type II secretory pathway component GspD/PulD (secretin)